MEGSDVLLLALADFVLYTGIKRFQNMCDKKADYLTSSPDIYALLKENARKNRRHMTDAEMMLWRSLKSWPRPYRFRRQHIIGDYIVDFVCLANKLVIEVDGEYHFTDEQKKIDSMRTTFLERNGFHVLRFTNRQVLEDINGVIEKIERDVYEQQ